MTAYFENIIIGLNVLYDFNMYVKFLLNLILFTIWSINLFFMHSLKLQKHEFRFYLFIYLFYDIAIDIWFSWKFTNIEDIIRKFNLIVNLL